jgi:hypothetical protein
MTSEERIRDNATRRAEPPPPDDQESVLDAEEEAAAEASQRPGPRGRIGGLPRDERARGERGRETGED